MFRIFTMLKKFIDMGEIAEVVELVDTLVLGTNAIVFVGSSPTFSTNSQVGVMRKGSKSN